MCNLRYIIGVFASASDERVSERERQIQAIDGCLGSVNRIQNELLTFLSHHQTPRQTIHSGSADAVVVIDYGSFAQYLASQSSPHLPLAFQVRSKR